jgi:hypothetical protein
VSLASLTLDEVAKWIEEWSILRLDLVLEMPFIRGGSRKIAGTTYSKQMRLVQELESGILYFIAPVLAECWVTEVTPNESKKMATGDGGADKLVVLNQYPNRRSVQSFTKTTQCTISDAWAHSLAGWGTAGVRRRYDSSLAAEVVEVCVGSV